MVLHYFLQLLQMPFTTRFISAELKFSGSIISGIFVLGRQKVSLQMVQLKCTWRSWCSPASQSSGHRAYLGEPVPSSITWMSPFSEKVFKVRYIVILSAGPRLFSISLKLMAACCCKSDFSTKMRIAVGAILRSVSFCSAFTIVIA